MQLTFIEVDVIIIIIKQQQQQPHYAYLVANYRNINILNRHIPLRKISRKTVFDLYVAITNSHILTIKVTGESIDFKSGNF